MSKLGILLLEAMPLLFIDNFSNLFLEISNNFIIADCLRNPADENLSFCEGLFDCHSLFVDYDSL